MPPPDSVFVVQHLHTHANGEEDVKTIGVYATRQDAESAVERLSEQPGFREHPRIVDPSDESSSNGFYVEEYRVGEDHWQEGYVTMQYGSSEAESP